MWHHFLKEIELAKNYHRLSQLGGIITPRNPLLEYLLPSLFIIKLMAILEDAFAQFISENGLSLQTNHRPSLSSRINCMNNKGKLVDYKALDKLRVTRNRLAHETVTQVGWDELENALDIVEIELQNLMFVGERPIYEFFAERSGAQASDEPNVLALFHYKYGIKSDNRVMMEISYIEKLYRDEEG